MCLYLYQHFVPTEMKTFQVQRPRLYQKGKQKSSKDQHLTLHSQSPTRDKKKLFSQKTLVPR